MATPIAYGADWSARQIYGDVLDKFRYTDLAGVEHRLSLVLRYADFPGQGHAVLTAEEYRSHLEVGIRSLLIYQRTTRDPDGGTKRGREFGEAAVAYARKIGYREGEPIFFTADAPIGSYNIDTAMAFFAAAVDVVRRAGFKGGIYGFQDIIWAAQDRGIGDVYWLCGAESGWRPGIQLYQWNNGRIYPGNPRVEADLVKQFEPIEGDDDMGLSQDVQTALLEGAAAVREGKEGVRPSGELYNLTLENNLRLQRVEAQNAEILGRPAADVDEAALAAELLRLGLGREVNKLPQDQLELLAKVTNDEADRRARARANVNIPPAEKSL